MNRTSPDSASETFRRPSSTEREQAWELVFADLEGGTPEASASGGGPKAGKLAEIAQLRQIDPHLEDGLFVACQKERIVGAVWTQIHPGRVAGFWPPVLVPGASESLADGLIRTAIEFLKSQSTRLAQTLLLTDVGPAAERLSRGGFRRLGEILYLVATLSSDSVASNPRETALIPYSEAERGMLRTIVGETYRESLDFPVLDPIRKIDDVLDGYASSGVSGTNDWFLAARDGQAIGCLLMADWPDSGRSEIVYMGLAPAARGHGWGHDLVQHAIAIAVRKGRQQLVLSVDADNWPAIRTYSEAGFVAWDRRSVFAFVVES